MQKLKKKFNSEICIFIVQLSVVVLIIFAVLFLKFINGKWFNNLKGFYIGNFIGDTKVSEVTEENSENIVYLSNNKDELTVMGTSINKNLDNSLGLPLNQFLITSTYGYRQDPFGNGIEFHKGVDLAGENGESIFASADGIIEISKYSKSYGNYLVISHSGGLKTLYAHCSKNLKSVGEKVSKGEVIGLVGSTGRSTGPHLHFEVILNGNNFNPEWLVSYR